MKYTHAVEIDVDVRCLFHHLPALNKDTPSRMGLISRPFFKYSLAYLSVVPFFSNVKTSQFTMRERETKRDQTRRNAISIVLLLSISALRTSLSVYAVLPFHLLIIMIVVVYNIICNY